MSRSIPRATHCLAFFFSTSSYTREHRSRSSLRYSLACWFIFTASWRMRVKVAFPAGAISFFTREAAGFGFLPYAQLLTSISSCNRQQLDCHVIFLLMHKLISSSLSSM
ncbi:hypothetical protein ACOSP7_032671 [Xanthoceras sorbifolium]